MCGDMAFTPWPLVTELCDRNLAKVRMRVASAVTRKSRTGRVLAAEERITVEQAIRAQTIDPAWQLFAENLAGSIAPGKYADLVVLDNDPRRADPDTWYDIGVHTTYLAGQPTYQA